MPRPQTLLSATLLAAVCAFSGAAIASAKAPGDACDTQFKKSDVSSLKKYDDCRFDRLEAKLDALSSTAPKPSPTATTKPSPSTSPTTSQPEPTETATTAPPTGGTNAATRILGPTRSGLPWHSGAWVGGRFNTATINGFGDWRGRPADVVTTYGATNNYATMMADKWAITTYDGFKGKLNYGLSILPNSGEGSFASIAAGDQDNVWRTVAKNLKEAGRGDSIVRVAWESNLSNWRWQATASNAPQFKAAFRRVVTTMRTEAPELKFEFGINCATSLAGSSDRMASLTTVYPGDDVVDLVGCDTYDWWNTHPTDDASWAKVKSPSTGAGLQDVVDFARAHGKGASFGEWGLAKTSNGNGGGDNPYFINAMYDFFWANRDVVAFECYFDEPDPSLESSIFGKGQNPKAAAMYVKRWHP